MANVTALIVAAGSGARMGGGVPKQFRLLGGKPVVRRAAEAVIAHPRIDAVRVVIAAGQEEMAAAALAGLAVGAPIVGGAERADSVLRGLEAIAGTAEIVLVHDAARPFCPPGVVDRLLDALAAHDAAAPVLPVADTLARANATLGEPIDRQDAVRVQTPQAARIEPLLQAYRDWRGSEPPTDETSVMRAAGHRVAAVAGDAMLEKLTTAADWTRAEALLASRWSIRTGFGFDVHAFEAGDGLWLGGIHIPHHRALKGHSDADVALHALTDALLGALGAGDIGDHFPPSDARWRGAPSPLFLGHARGLVEARGGRIEHVDLTIICEAPRIGPHKAAIRDRIAGLLRLAPDRVSVKATTTERLGFTGRGEGIAAQAVATVRLEEGA